MLDLSAPFDTIDHGILLNRLGSRFGFHGTVLNWFSSYLRGRVQRVVVGTDMSVEHPSDCSVPQGSVLGPVLFSMYPAPIENIILRHGFQYMMYADNTQLYVTCEGDHVSMQGIEDCVNEICHWMGEN